MSALDQALAVIRGTQLAAASAGSGVPAPTAAALIPELPIEAAEGVSFDSNASWDRLGVGVVLPGTSFERGLRALQRTRRFSDAHLEALLKWIKLIPSDHAELHISEPANDKGPTVSWMMSVGTSPGDIRGFCETLDLDSGHIDTLMQRVRLLDVSQANGVALVLGPDGPPTYRFRLYQYSNLDRLDERLAAMDGCAEATGVSKPQRRWLGAALSALIRHEGKLFAPVELSISADGVRPEMRVSLFQLPQEQVLRLVHQFTSDAQSARKLGVFAAAGGEQEEFEWLHLTARDTEPPGIGFAIAAVGAPAVGETH